MKMPIVVSLVLVILVLGCQSNSDPLNQPGSSGGGTDSEKEQPKKPIVDRNQDTNTDEGSESETNKGSQPDNRQKITSVYTDLDEKKCKTIDKNEDEAWIVQECPGIGGYKLEVVEGDIRQTINVISPSNKKSELKLWSVVSPAFSYVGKKAEWRIKTIEGKPRPFALIVRFDASEDPENPDKTTSYLTVTKIDGDSACVTDVVKPIRNANVKARELADSSSGKPCKTAR